jgi:hypothetical protein
MLGVSGERERERKKKEGSLRGEKLSWMVVLYFMRFELLGKTGREITFMMK